MKQLIYCLIILAVTGCGHEDISKDTYCYILCDFTKSQDKISRSVIVSNADSVFRSATNKGYSCAVFDISDEVYQEPFFKIPLNVSSIQTDRERTAYETWLKGQKESFRDSLIRVSQHSNGNTCLINSIEKIATLLAGDSANKENRNIKIILLSDMLEDCSFGDFRINIDNGGFKNAEQALNKLNTPPFTFEGYKNLEINVVASSTRKISVKEHNEFWQKVFKRFGYTLTTSINPQLPRWVTEE